MANINTITVQVNESGIHLNVRDLSFSFSYKDDIWEWEKDYKPFIECEEGIVYFADAIKKEYKIVEFGLGKGIICHFREFIVNNLIQPYGFDTLIWIEKSTGHIFCEWIPICEEGLKVKKVFWPAPMEFRASRKDWYTLLPFQQGLMIPNTWQTELGPISFDGFFGTAGGYMPWFSQIRENVGYLAICMTPWNAGYQAEHPANGDYTHISMRFEPSLGKMDYRRIIRFSFYDNCDFNSIAKEYRQYVKEQGRLRTLREKAVTNQGVYRLIGSSFVHRGIKTKVSTKSDFFDPADPEKNNNLTSFAQREDEIKHLYELGVKKLYLHLDGWAEPGYDNKHPDYLPACEEAGGWQGMKSLVDTMHNYGYLFGIHDQYRDYYKDSPSFSEDYACRLEDGSIPEHSRWAGGPQSYLCGSQAPYYVRRNFTEIKNHNIDLDCAYLDVFTCNEGDECFNPQHRMTRRECYEYRNMCFEYLLSHNILSSSEEVSDWSVPSLVFCHYAPYDFMLREPELPKYGVPIPLYNLVYHDCVLQPWMMDKISEQEDYMLYALLNGGAPYLIRDGAYPNFDGSFDKQMELKLEADIERSKVVANLHEKVAMSELVKYQFLDENFQVHRAIFDNGITVTVDFKQQKYWIDNGN